MILYSALTAVSKRAGFLRAVLKPQFCVTSLCSIHVAASQGDLEQDTGGFNGGFFSKILFPPRARVRAHGIPLLWKWSCTQCPSFLIKQTDKELRMKPVYIVTCICQSNGISDLYDSKLFRWSYCKCCALGEATVQL